MWVAALCHHFLYSSRDPCDCLSQIPPCVGLFFFFILPALDLCLLSSLFPYSTLLSFFPGQLAFTALTFTHLLAPLLSFSCNSIRKTHSLSHTHALTTHLSNFKKKHSKRHITTFMASLQGKRTVRGKIRPPPRRVNLLHCSFTCISCFQYTHACDSYQPTPFLYSLTLVLVVKLGREGDRL